MKFWYKFKSVEGDSVQAGIILTKGNGTSVATDLGFSYKIIATSTSVWTLAEMPLHYVQPYAPDSIFIRFRVGNFTPAAGNKFWIDDISMEYTTAVEEPGGNGPVRLYPNPVRSAFTVELDKEQFSVRVFNAAGQLVYDKAANNGSSYIDCKSWAPGMYTAMVAKGENLYREVPPEQLRRQ